MKKLLLALAITMFAATACGQVAVRTEAASNKYLRIVGADTATIDSAAYVVGVVFSLPVNNGTFTVHSGISVLDTVAALIMGATAPTASFYVTIGAKVDSLTVYQTGAAQDATIIYRQKY